MTNLNEKDPNILPPIMQKIKDSKYWRLGDGGGPSNHVSKCIECAKKMLDFTDMEEFYRSDISAQDILDLAVADAYIASEAVLQNTPSRGETEFMSRILNDDAMAKLDSMLTKSIMASGAGISSVAMQFLAIGYALGKRALLKEMASGKKSLSPSRRGWNPFRKEE